MLADQLLADRQPAGDLTGACPGQVVLDHLAPGGRQAGEPAAQQIALLAPLDSPLGLALEVTYQAALERFRLIIQVGAEALSAARFADLVAGNADHVCGERHPGP